MPPTRPQSFFVHTVPINTIELKTAEVGVSEAARRLNTGGYRLVGLVVKASASRAEDPGFE